MSKKCKYCHSTDNLMTVSKLHDYKIDFETGITMSRIGRKQVMCNSCFMKKVWNKK